MINGQELNLALGLPVYMTGFRDEKPRRCYPYKMEDFYKFNSYTAFINVDDYEENFKSDEAMASLMTLLIESFPEEKDQDALLKAVDGENYKSIIADIKKVNGVADDVGERDVEKTGSAMSWEDSISAIPVYTANTFEDIKKMTFLQLTNCLSAVGKKINWEYKTSTINLVEDPNDYIADSDHPLSSTEKKTQMTMEDLKGLV
jgi:hypothetical protein